jgi:phosphoribosylaminoimidazole carboxylase
MFPATIMLNLLGGSSKSSHEELLKHTLTIPTAALHMYGKESKPARKTGQMTLVASMSQAQDIVDAMQAERKDLSAPHDNLPDCSIPSIPVFRHSPSHLLQ